MSEPAQYMWKRTGMRPTWGLMGTPEGSRSVIVSCGAATIHVSGGWSASVVGASDCRQPAVEPVSPATRAEPTRTTARREDIGEPHNARSWWKAGGLAI